jgi:putative Mg2+ transporter-C (MgtC) family protein
LVFIQFWIDDKFEHRNYKITFRKDCAAKPLNDKVSSLKLNQTKTKILRANMQAIIEFEISGKESNLDLFNEWLIENQSILSI